MGHIWENHYSPRLYYRVLRNKMNLNDKLSLQSVPCHFTYRVLRTQQYFHRAAQRYARSSNSLVAASTCEFHC